MENNTKKAIDNFLNSEETFDVKVVEQKKKFIKSDKTIFERASKQIILEDGRYLLSE